MKPITLTDIDKRMLKREHIDWEKEDVRDDLKQSFERNLAAVQVELANTRDTAYFWRNMFILLASGVLFVTVLGFIRMLMGW